MRAVRCLAFLVAVSLAACTLAAAAEPMLLKFHQKEGDKAVYTLTATAAGRSTVSGAATKKAKAKSEAGTETVSMRIGLDFTKAIGMGRIEVTSRILEGTAKAVSGGKSETESLAGLELRQVVTARGDVRSDQVLAGETVTLPFSEYTFTPDEALPAGLLPDRAVKIGDTWSGVEERSPLEGTQGQLRYSSKLLGEETYAGRRCLRIRTEGRGAVRGDLELSGLTNRLPTKISLTATETWLFDPAEGIVVKSDMKATLSGGATLEGVAAAYRFTATVDRHLRLTEWNGEKLAAK